MERVTRYPDSIKVEMADGSTKWVPVDIRNADYRELQKWEAAGGTVLLPPARPQEEVTAESIEKRAALQARLAGLERELEEAPADADAIRALITAARAQLEQLRRGDS